MSLIQATRTKKRCYTIMLASADQSSFQSAVASGWNASYFINLNAIMSAEEQDRPYFVSFEFASSSGNDIDNQYANSGYPLLQLNFGGRSYPHIYQYSQRWLPCGFIPIVASPNVGTAPDACFSAKASDNNPVYIHSLKNISSIALQVIDNTGNILTFNERFVCFIHLEPADF